MEASAAFSGTKSVASSLGKTFLPSSPEASPQQTRKRERGGDVSADVSVPEETPSPSKSSRRSPRTPEIAPPPRIRPKKLGFDEVAQNSTLNNKEKQENKEQGHLSSSATLTETYKKLRSDEEEEEKEAHRRKKKSQKKKLGSSSLKKTELPQESVQRFSPRLVPKSPLDTPTLEDPKDDAKLLKPAQIASSKDDLQDACVPEAEVSSSKWSSPSTGYLTDVCTGERSSKKAVKTPRKTFLDYIVVDRVKFCIRDDVYIRRTEEDVDEEAEGCLVCGKSGKLVECDNCSRGVHLKCTDPPLMKVPEGDWICSGCEAMAKSSTGSHVSKLRINGHTEMPKTARELLLASKLWAARIERCTSNPFYRFA